MSKQCYTSYVLLVKHQVFLLVIYQVMIAALFQLAPMCLTALDEASVLTMMYANVRRSGLVKTVPSSLVDLSITALVGVLSCPVS